MDTESVERSLSRDEMVGDGWISRERSASDGRQRGVRLTPEGILVAEKAIDSLMIITGERAKELRQESTPPWL